VPWSEAGMPTRLREAIASVRRVSYEMHEPPGDDYAVQEPVPFGDHADFKDSSPEDGAAFDGPPPDERTARLAYDARSKNGQTARGTHAAYGPPAQDDFALLDERARVRHKQPPDVNAGLEESHAVEPLLLRDEDASGEKARRLFGAHRRYEEPPPDHAPSVFDNDPAYQYHEVALDEQPPVDETPRAPLSLYDEEDQASAPGRRHAADEPLPLQRRAKTRYGLHAAAFAVAIAFVALAGFGLGFLSDDRRDASGSLARDRIRAAAPTETAPPSTEPSTPQAEREQATELSELTTVRVEPAPGVAVPEPAPAARPTVSALPLPPPPKPVFEPPAPAFEPSAPSPPAEATPSDRQLAGLIEDAAAVLLKAEEDAGGTGGPFEPLFTKLPSAQPPKTRVFVHYSSDAVGAPATARHLVRHLKAEGFAVEARAVEFSIPTNSIRYFFDADRAQAEALRSRLEGQVPGGADLSVMDFTSYEPRPRPGLIEVWLRA
jgi:hypothetical protein